MFRQPPKKSQKNSISFYPPSLPPQPQQKKIKTKSKNSRPKRLHERQSEMLTIVPIKQKMSTLIKSIIYKCFLYNGNSKINRVKMIRIYIYLGVSDIKVIPIETEKK